MLGFPGSKAIGGWMLKILALALIYYGAARLGLLLAFASTNVTPVWPPSGIALAAFLFLGNRAWPGVFIGAFAANLAVFSANHVADEWTITLMSGAIASGNTLEALTGAFLLRRLVDGGRYFRQPANIYKFVLAAILAATASAAVGTFTLITGGIVPAGAWWSISSLWWLGDASGMLVLTPLLLTWGAPGLLRATMREVGIILLFAAVLGVGLFMIFGQPYATNLNGRWVAYLILPIIGWAAYRYQQRGVTAVLAVVTTTAVLASTHGLGPFATGTLQDSLMTLEIFIGLCSVVGLALAADMDTRLQGNKGFSLRAQPWSFLNWPTLFLCLGLTIVAWHFISSNTQRQAEERFKFIADTVKQRIDERMAVYESLLHAGQGLFSASQEVKRGQWHEFVEHLEIERNFPGVLGIGYAQRVTRSQQDALVRSVRSDGLADFRIWPAGEREEYVPIIYIEPNVGGNRQALGFDMFSQPTRHAAMVKARDSGEAAITRKVTLVQNKSKDNLAGFLMYEPVYRNGAPTRTKDERIAALEGYVYSPFRMRDLMMGILGGSLPEVAVQIYDGTEENDATLMYSSDSLASLGHDYPNALTSSKLISAVTGEKNWALRITSLPPFEASIDRQKSLIVLIAGTMISLLFFGIVSDLAKTRETAEALADHMIAALKESNISLQQSEERFRLLTSKVKDYAILLLDPEGKILTWNEGAQRLSGYGEGEIVGRSFEILYCPEDIEAGKPKYALQQARSTGQYESSGWHVSKDGRRYYADVLLTALHDDSDALIGFAKITRDITQEKRIEQELRAAIEQAESASRAKSEFVANMSHELRTPMNAVLGVTYLLGSSALSPEQQKYLNMIRTSGQSLLDILNDILDFSKIEAGRMELSPAEFRLGELLDAIATIMSVNAAEKDLELVIAVGAGVPQTLVGDELRLQQILLNLVGNAIKFTERGEVSLTVELAEAAVEVTSGADALATLRIRVRDTGIGVSAEQQARLFSPFTQADSSMTRRFGGSGLGLTICRRLVGLMGGDITIQSQLGRGSEFCVVIPFKAGATEEDPKRPRSALPAARLLIADDSRASRENFQSMAQGWGWQAELAATGAEAIEALRRALIDKRPFDAVFLDWQLPDMNGMTMLESIREFAPAVTPPVVFTANAYGRNELMNLGAASKADFILAKPITCNTLYDTMIELFVHRARTRKSTARENARPPVEQWLSGVRILLAEDNVLNQIVAKGMLEQSGAKVDIVENGQMAVDLLRVAPQRYDLVLMDVQMPVMDGFAATRLIRTWVGSDVPVLAMTAGVTETERKQCTDAGMDDFIAKPIELNQMLATIRKYLPDAAEQSDSKAGFESAAPTRASGASLKSILNMGQLTALASGNAGFESTILGLVEGIVGKGIAPLEEARRAWAAGEDNACAKVLHRLRGEIGSLGAERLVDATAVCEQAIKGGERERIPALLEQVEAELRLALGQARSWLAGREPGIAGSHSDAPPVRAELEGKEIEALKTLLAAQNIDACERYRSMRPALARHMATQDLGALDHAIERLDFAAALAHLPEF
jgi:PAS domain S-box-containing protein